MPDFVAEEVVQMVRRGQGLERADLRHIELRVANLEKANFRRADLEGANFEGSNLKGATLANANLREAYLAGANLRGAFLQKADLEGANLERCNLQDADLSRANLEGANLEGAKLDGARLTSSQLELANLGGASLQGVDLSKADLREVYLGGAKLHNVNLRFAHMEKVNLEEAELDGADMTEANLRSGYLQGAVLRGAVLERAILDEATLIGADLSGADLRGGSLRNAKTDDLQLTAAKLAGVSASPEQFERVKADWVEFAGPDGGTRVEGSELVAFYTRLISGVAVAPVRSDSGANRYFGPGDVLRNAALEFSADSIVEIQSRFVDCSITLADGARITIGGYGSLEGCRILGPGEIVVAGRFVQSNGQPSIVGPKRLIVNGSGAIDGMVEQHRDLTQFAFEPGCALRMNIVRHNGLKGDVHV